MMRIIKSFLIMLILSLISTSLSFALSLSSANYTLTHPRIVISGGSANSWHYSLSDVSVGNTTSGQAESANFTLDATHIDQPILQILPHPPTVEPVTSPTNVSMQTLSGTKDTNTSIWINGEEVIPLTSQTSWSYAFNLVEGTNLISLSSKDALGNESQAITISIILDTILPTGAIKMNNDEQYTNSTEVILSLTCQDNAGGTGIDKMQFSNDNINWSIPESYATSKSWTLTEGDGAKSVYVKFTDGVGNRSISYSDFIILDTTPPQIHITEPKDNTRTNLTLIIVSGTVDGNNAKVEVNGIIASINEGIFTVKDIRLQDGPNTITATATDSLGNISSSSITITKFFLSETVLHALQKVADNYGLVNDMQADMTLSATLDGQAFGEPEHCIYYFLQSAGAIKEKTETYTSGNRTTKEEVIIIDGTNMYLVNPNTHEIETEDLLSETATTVEQFNQMDICYNLTGFISGHIIIENQSESDLANGIVVIEATPISPSPLYSKLKLYINSHKGLIFKSLLYAGELLELKQIMEITDSQQMSNGAWIPVTMAKKPMISSAELIITTTYSDIQINIGLTEEAFDPNEQ